jgi:pilus assembly protein CpaB
MNPGQSSKKFLFMALGLGLVGAILVYVAFSRSGGSSGASGDQVPVVVARTDIEARTKITQSMIEVKLVSPDDASSLAYKDTADVVGQVTRFPITANEQVLSNKIVPLSGTTSVAAKSLSFVVPAGMRAIAITTKEVTNAGGLLLPGDYVDVLVVYDIVFQNDPANPASHEKEDSFLVDTLFQRVEVLAVSQSVVDTVPDAQSTPSSGSTTVRNSEGKAQPDAVTVTLALSPEDAAKLYLASENGRIRFTVRNYTDSEQKPLTPVFETDLWPRSLPNPFIR